VKLLALDFDGVISDSAPEAFLVALRTYCELRPASGLSVARERAEALAPAGLREDSLYRAFLDLMPLGNGAEDFGVALATLDRGTRLADQADHDAAREAQAPEFRDCFRRRFYEVRSELRNGDPARWSELLGPYPELLALLRRRSGAAALAIATAKDRESVLILLRQYGIHDLIPAELVLDKESGRDKTAHLARLHERLAIPYADITFVDDKVNHLESVSATGVVCALAGWGYNGSREHARARELGHLVCTLDDFERQIFEA